MTGGTQSEFRYSDFDFSQDNLSLKAQEVSEAIDPSKNIINTVNLYKITGEESFIVEAGFTRDISVAEIETYKVNYRDTLEEEFQKL